MVDASLKARHMNMHASIDASTPRVARENYSLCLRPTNPLQTAGRVFKLSDHITDLTHRVIIYALQRWDKNFQGFAAFERFLLLFGFMSKD